LAALLAALALIAGPGLGAAAAQQNPQDNGLIKVYVVRTAAANNGVADTLPEIAQRTLGNQSRSTEIFDLNKGRTQSDGGSLTSANQTLNPGWILRLPADASGPFVQFGRDNGTSAGDTGVVEIPVILAVIGGVLLLVLTLLILLRRQTARAARSIGRSVRVVGARIAAPGRRSRARKARQLLAQQWRGDTAGPGAVRAALIEAARTLSPAVAGPVAADLTSDVVRVLPAPDVAPPPPWQIDGERGWSRPRWTNYAPNPSDVDCRPVRVGGSADRQTFVDLSYCDSVVSFDGDPTTANEVLGALLNEITTYHPDLRVAVLGALPGLNERVGQFRHSSDLATVIGPQRPFFDTPVRAAAQRHRITGVVAVPASTPDAEGIEVARLCGTRGSTWLALIVGDVPGAHWRCQVHRDGTMDLPWLDRTLVATV
jgi:hypothetical protein